MELSSIASLWQAGLGEGGGWGQDGGHTTPRRSAPGSDSSSRNRKWRPGRVPALPQDYSSQLCRAGRPPLPRGRSRGAPRPRGAPKPRGARQPNPPPLPPPTGDTGEGQDYNSRRATRLPASPAAGRAARPPRPLVNPAHGRSQDAPLRRGGAGGQALQLPACPAAPHGGTTRPGAHRVTAPPIERRERGRGRWR